MHHILGLDHFKKKLMDQLKKLSFPSGQAKIYI